MTIKQQGGIFGRNPTFNDVTATDLTTNDLTVDGSATLNNGATITSNGSTVLDVTATSGNDSRIRITAPNNKISYLEFGDPDDVDTGEIRYHHSTDTMQFRTNGNNVAAEFTSSGNLAFPSGQGIDFSATSGTGTSELFDDYEEGTFTPEFYGSGLSVTYDIQSGKYVKIGNIVFFTILLGTDAVSGGSSSTALEISGMPYSMDTTNKAAQKISWSYGFGTDVSNGSWVAGSASRLDLYLHDNTATTIKTDVLATGTNDNRLYITGQYFVG